jgi:hypothetical protein
MTGHDGSPITARRSPRRAADNIETDFDCSLGARSMCSLRKFWHNVATTVRKRVLPLEATEEMQALQQAHLTKRDALQHDITGKPLMKHRQYKFPAQVQSSPPPPVHRTPPKWKVVCYAQARPDLPHTVQAVLLAISPFILIFALVASLGEQFDEERKSRGRLHYGTDGAFKRPLDPIQESDDER